MPAFRAPPGGYCQPSTARSTRPPPSWSGWLKLLVLLGAPRRLLLISEGSAELREFVAPLAWTSNDGPRALFDRATAWLIDHKVLLPGATRPARLVAAERTAALERLWDEILDGVDAEIGDRLNGLLEVEAGSRFSVLERLRTAPTRVTGLELERALRRLADVRRHGTSRVDVSAVPSPRLLALARYGFSAKAPSLRDLAEPRRTATLVATIRHLVQKATDDALDLLEVPSAIEDEEADDD